MSHTYKLSEYSEALRQRISIIERELRDTRTPRTRGPLPNLEDAWRLPIPSELITRQNDMLKVRTSSGKVRYTNVHIVATTGALRERLAAFENRVRAGFGYSLARSDALFLPRQSAHEHDAHSGERQHERSNAHC